MITDADLFNLVERWAVGTTEGFVAGRIPAEDQVPFEELVSKLTWLSMPGVDPAPLPEVVPVVGPLPEGADKATVGPFSEALSIKLPDFLAKWFGVPLDTGRGQTSEIVSVQSQEPISIRDFPTCTRAGIFDALKPGEHPPHPILDFNRPVDHVHVRLSDENGRMLWDASYIMDGKTTLDNSLKESIKSESLVPDYIPACAVKSANLKLEVDAEYMDEPLRVELLNPGGIEDEGAPIRVVERPHLHRPEIPRSLQNELERTDAVVCQVTKQDPAKANELIDRHAIGRGVYLPDKYKEALWRIDRTREESSEINPHGIPMRELVSSSSGDGSTLQSNIMKSQEPVSVGKYHILPRRPLMPAEIRVDQLERKEMHVFDARKMPKEISQVDKYAIKGSDDMFHQPTVKRTVYGPMWQGYHDGARPLHPSFQFKNPANVAHVRLIDKSDHDRLMWDAVFDVKGAHKIAADQKSIGGELNKFKGLDPPTRKGHLYSMTVEADNPATVLPQIGGGTGPRLIDFWRKSEFIFAAARPTAHSDIFLRVIAPTASPLGLS